MPSTSAPDHAKKEALKYLNGFGKTVLDVLYAHDAL